MDKLIVFSFFLPIFLTLPIFYQFLPPPKTTNKKIEPKSNKQNKIDSEPAMYIVGRFPPPS